MVKKFLIIPVFLFLGYGLMASNDFATIASGIAIFVVGMFFMEDGFKLFTGGTLSKILKKTTDTYVKAVMSGFAATAIVQSSSLISVIAISFLTAELIALPQAIGIIFGANIGTTTTAWIVSAFGMKIKIAVYAMPMLVFGVLFTFSKNNALKGVGNILLGLGFIFLGISFMKDGFDTLKSGIDLAQYSVDGFAGIVVFIAIGAIATVIIQSSSATMALIITAVATGQIDYMNSLSLAIGANVGTTVTAVLGALTSNANGKRLAVAHFIFNMITALFAVVFIKVLMNIVDILSSYVGIGDQDIAMKLALFHTIFNVAGVLIITPFTGRLVRFLNTLFVFKGDQRGKPRYLDDEVIKTPGPAIVALQKETEHLYDSVSHIIAKALGIQSLELFSDFVDEEKIELNSAGEVDIDRLYEKRIKYLYSDILKYAIKAESIMDKTQRERVYQLKLASRDIVEAIKEIRELQKNIQSYMGQGNKYIIEEYNFLRDNLATVLQVVKGVRDNPESLDTISAVVQAKEVNKGLDIVAAKRLSILLRQGKITDIMASSLMNDGSYTSKIAGDLLRSGSVLWGHTDDGW